MCNFGSQTFPVSWLRGTLCGIDFLIKHMSSDSFRKLLENGIICKLLNTLSRVSVRLGQGVSWPPKIWSGGQKLHMALVTNRCQSNSNGHHFKGWGENKRNILHDKSWFLTWSPLKKWFLRAWHSAQERCFMIDSAPYKSTTDIDNEPDWLTVIIGVIVVAPAAPAQRRVRRWESPRAVTICCRPPSARRE